MRRFNYLPWTGSQFRGLFAGRRSTWKTHGPSQFRNHDTPASHARKIQGPASDIKIMSDYMQKSRQRLNRVLAVNTGRSEEEIARDTERDNFMSAEEALEYGLIDSILTRR